MGMSKMNILLPSTNWYCKTTSNSTWFWHDIRFFFFKLSTLRPKRTQFSQKMTPFRRPLDDSSAVHSKNCIARESPIFPEYNSTLGANRWAFYGRVSDSVSTMPLRLRTTWNQTVALQFFWVV